MGYTHYWKSESTKNFDEATKDKAFNEVVKFVKWADGELKNLLADGHGKEGTKPEITEERMWFNGIETNEIDGAHETMEFEAKWNGEFVFCKTAHKDYDVVAVGSLCMYKHVLGESVTFTSDGDRCELREGYMLYMLHCEKRGITPKTEDELLTDIRIPRHELFVEAEPDDDDVE